MLGYKFKKFVKFFLLIGLIIFPFHAQAERIQHGLILSKERVNDLIKLNVAERKVGGKVVVSYLRLEAFEGEKTTTRDERTSFQFAVIEYEFNLKGIWVPISLDITFLNLNWEGKLDPAGTAATLKYKLFYGEITKKEAYSNPAKKFYSSLPSWAKKQLHITSGFLSENPGRPIAKYQLSDSEMATKLLSELVSLAPAPKVAKKWVGSEITLLMEYAAKKMTSAGILSLAKQKQFRWGLSNYINNETIGDRVSHYEKVGKGMWNF